MQRKTAWKEAWRPKCAAPRLVYDSALFFETFVHVYVRTTRTAKHIERKKKEKKPPRRSGLGMDMHLRTKIQDVLRISQKRRGHEVLVRKTCVLHVVACDYLVLV